jgi:large subunit ribosomal protein L25
MNTLVLSAIPRTLLGKSVIQLREQGLVPAVIYGPDMENVVISVSSKELNELLKKSSENPIIELKIGEGNDSLVYKVLIHELHRDYLSQAIDHIDFYRFSATKKVRVEVPIEITGVSLAVADLGGVLLQNIDKLEVECLPEAIPQQFTVDISVLKDLNDTLYIKDLTMPQGVVCHMDSHTPIVSVTEPEKEEVVPAAPTEPAEILTEAEVKRQEQEKEQQDQAAEPAA